MPTPAPPHRTPNPVPPPHQQQHSITKRSTSVPAIRPPALALISMVKSPASISIDGISAHHSPGGEEDFTTYPADGGATANVDGHSPVNPKNTHTLSIDDFNGTEYKSVDVWTLHRSNAPVPFVVDIELAKAHVFNGLLAEVLTCNEVGPSPADSSASL